MFVAVKSRLGTSAQPFLVDGPKPKTGCLSRNSLSIATWEAFDLLKCYLRRSRGKRQGRSNLDSWISAVLSLPRVFEDGSW